jgi:hypothetical protein
MATPTPDGDPFAAALAEAVQTSVMAWRLVTAMADAVRRLHQRREHGREADLPLVDEAVSEASAAVTRLVPGDIAAAVMGSADWPQMAQQLVVLRRAGVDLDTFLPDVGRIAVTVRDQVAASVRVPGEGTGEWERVLRETLPAGPVREAILASPTWPDMAATMAKLDARGADVRQVLTTALATSPAALAAGFVAGTSRDAMHSYGPLTFGLDVPKDLDLADRARALRQMAISPTENARYGRWVRETLAGHERGADLLLTARQWPLLAARMAKMESEGQPVRQHLERLLADVSWQEGPSHQLGSRLVQATNEALRRPLDSAAGKGRQVNPGAARSQSTTAGPTKGPRQAAPAEPGVPAHRQTTARGRGRGR